MQRKVVNENPRVRYMYHTFNLNVNNYLQTSSIIHLRGVIMSNNTDLRCYENV